MTADRKIALKYRKILFPVLIVLALLTFAALFLPPEPVWITDNGNKLMIMHQFLRHDTVFFHHPSPENFPCGGFHFQHLADNKIISFHSPYLPVLTAFVCRIAGNSGVLFIPVLSLALIAAILTGLPGKKSYVLTALAAAPLCFYALLLWEMLPAALAVTAAAWLFFHRRTFAAGIVFGAGLWMREELFLAGAVIAAILLFKRQWRMMLKFGAGAAIPAVMLLLSNYLLTGHILGVHGSTYFINNRPEMTAMLKCREILFNFYQHLIRFDTLSRWSGIIAAAALLPVLIAGAAPDYRKFFRFKLIAGTIFTIAVCLFAAGLWKEKQYLLISAGTFGLFISVPVTVGFLLNYRALLSDRHQLILLGAWSIAGYILAVPFLLNPHDIGLTWGARHFIMILPLMIYLSVYAAAKAGFFRCPAGRYLAICCTAAGLLIQIYGINALVKVTDDAASLQHKILEMPQKTVVSDLFFLPEMTPQVPFAKIQLEIAGEKQLTAAINFLERENIEEFILILSPDYRRIDNAQLARLLRRYPPRIRPEPFTLGNSLNFLLTICRKKEKIDP